MGDTIREVDPNDLRLPPSRASGADPWKLHQQIGKYGIATDGMPPIFVYEDPDGVLEISDGVTRATRIAKMVTKAELFVALQGLAEIIPEMRGGQLVAAVGELCADLHGRGLWDATDVELLEAVWQFRRNFEAAITTRNGSAAQPSDAAERPRD
jgi:hypothetical protein